MLFFCKTAFFFLNSIIKMTVTTNIKSFRFFIFKKAPKDFCLSLFFKTAVDLGGAIALEKIRIVGEFFVGLPLLKEEAAVYPFLLR